MQEQLKEILEKMGKRLDLVITGALIFILILVGFFYMKEQSFVLPEEGTPQTKTWTVRLPTTRFGKPDETSAKAVAEIEKRYVNIQPKIENDPAALRLIRTNMFDQKSVQEQSEARRELNKKFQQADGLFKQDKVEESLKIVDEILKQDPSHPEARNLKEFIEKRLNPGAPAGTEAPKP